MSVLVLAEAHDGHLLTDLLARTLSAVAPLGDADVLVTGGNSAGAAEEAAKLAGVSKVLLADDPSFAHGLAEPLAALIRSLAGDYTHIAAGATAFSRNALPRAAMLLEAMVLSDVTAIKDAETFERPVYAGNAIQTVRSADPIKIFTVRTAGFSPVGAGGPAPVTSISVPPDPGLSEWVEDRTITSERPDLTSAKIVVSGGRGLGSAENFHQITALADKLDAAVGASRAAVDAGYAPNDWQVGQTGKIVAPDLYIAVGISGAIQHLAGMKDSRIIVAINKDEDAPIFQVADYGLVGDLFRILPELTEKI
ncbi:electron transfer flavoprotein subunit alpha/FixB family protein [Acetobacter musti]|uniref:Electron transfer flavoprotein subunit alpha/FixB family protein n=1 Tax=Acetobacter musti TaxID=864732 RepID=A0ABX0JL10_9PROT|nr:FAD-binding protein [Acetobacter musti]NHN84128.1 electron transfer flavoprotein subunit alpha/FixB family protein [Acetobacter musti]